MSPTEQPDPGQNSTGQSIETVYTTVESQQDRTDWLTVVSNLRQINRQLVEEIARLEESLANTTQALHSQKEQNQSHEITILQYQDEIRIARDRIGALFQQLENSHQIGQRQQTLIENLSQQLEIAQAAIALLEAEKAELDRQYQQQSFQLMKAERVAVELHRRLKLQTNVSMPTPPTTNESEPEQHQQGAILATFVDDEPAPDRSESEPVVALEPLTTTAAIDPAPPLTPLHLPDIESPRRQPTPPTLFEKTTISPANPRTSWRDDIATNNRHYANLAAAAPDLQCSGAEIVDRESTALEDQASPTIANWPAPSIPSENQPEGATVKPPVKIDLPKFPKRPEN